MEHTFTDATVMGGMLALALGLVELVKTVVAKIKPAKSSKPVNVTLDQESIKILREGLDATNDVRKIVEVRDQNGVPLVYCSRAILENQEATLEIVRQIASCQEKTAYALDRLNEKLDDVEDDVNVLVRRSSNGSQRP